MVMPAQKPGKSKQDYGTPMSLIHAIEKRFGIIACDLAATAENTKCPSRFYTPEANSLTQPRAEHFPAGLLWLNPPFANIAPWAEKCAAESLDRHGLITLLVPASIGSNWFAQHVEGKAVVIGLSPRITFEGESTPYPKDYRALRLRLPTSWFSDLALDVTQRETKSMARKITDESRIVAFFMKQPPAECALMQKTITHILANRSDVTQPAKKERKKRALKSETSLLARQGD